MKTLSQQLQSRISLRRNFIAELETEAQLFKHMGFNWHSCNKRRAIKPLSADQKLDKQLFNVLTGMGQIGIHL